MFFIVGMAVTLVLYVAIGFLISRKVKNADDYFVAGRNAPTMLITGSLVASFIGVGLFMGDVGESYSGFFAPIIVAVGVLSVGYILGSIFFGRYLRRSEANTIPEFFGKRFDSGALKMLASITGSFIMIVSSLSCVQGIGTLMSMVTGLHYNVCIIIAVAVFTLITISSGAKGVLITDTIMYALFSVAAIIGAIFVAVKAGGWTSTVSEMATYEEISGILSGSGNLDYFYSTGVENMVWAVGYGIAWMAVLMVAPWQSSRYLMAKSEHTVIRSGIIASASVFVIEFLMCMAGVFIQKINPGMESASHALIWASMEVMPKILGVVVLSGVLASAISSATTFLSLVSSNITKDIAKIKDERKQVVYGKWIAIIVAAVLLFLCILNPPQIFWITYLGATIVACSWLPVSIASVWSKRVTKVGAFASMLSGFVVSTVMKLITVANDILLPIYFDPFFVGIAVSIIALIVGSLLTKVTDKEKEEREKLFIAPEENNDPKTVRTTKIFVLATIGLGLIITIVMLALWVIPYLNGLQ